MDALRRGLVALLALGLLAAPVSAGPAIGLLSRVGAGTASEGALSCVEYGLYNPADISDSDALVTLSASGELATYAVPPGEPTLVKRGTPSASAVPVKLCFDIPQLYQSCLAGGFLCLPTSPCPGEDACALSPGGAVCDACRARLVSLKGNVVASPAAPPKAPGGVAGSEVAVSVAQPLELTVVYSPNWFAFYRDLGLVLLAIGAVFGALKYRARKPPEERKRLKAERLRKRLEELEKK